MTLEKVRDKYLEKVEFFNHRQDIKNWKQTREYYFLAAEAIDRLIVLGNSQAFNV